MVSGVFLRLFVFFKGVFYFLGIYVFSMRFSRFLGGFSLVFSSVFFRDLGHLSK